MLWKNLQLNNRSQLCEQTNKLRTFVMTLIKLIISGTKFHVTVIFALCL